jgi:DNA-nicking Smr family endonuclease
MKDEERLLQKPFAELARSMKKERARERRRELLATSSRAGAAPRTAAAEGAEAKEEEPVAAPLSDHELFAREVASAVPIGRDNCRPPARGGLARPPARDEDAEALAELADLVNGEGLFDIAGSDEYIEGSTNGVDRRLLKKLRKGVFAVQAHIDLHGRTRLEARELVEEFVVESRRRSLRCVLIVHGRGLNSKDQIPVLKESLKVWLARGRIARSVLAFCSARPSDGGYGALYVLLRG